MSKRAHPGSEHSKNLESEYKFYERLQVAWKKYPELVKHIQLPKTSGYHGLHGAEPDEVSKAVALSLWRNEYTQLLPAQGQEPSAMMSLERILPLPRIVRHALIDAYLPAELSDQAESLKTSTYQKQCLTRLHLGERSVEVLQPPISKPPGTKTFDLRNFPLHANKLEDLGLDLTLFAESIASAYAAIHWAARIDGNDIEVVLGTSASSGEPLERTVQLFVLEFGRCERIEVDEDEATATAVGILRNSAYAPRPSRENARDQALWETFKEFYPLKSADVPGGEGFVDSDLPPQVIERLEQHCEDEL